MTLFVTATLVARRASAERATKIPEPVLEESITDIDRAEAGELEAEGILGVTRDGAGRRTQQTGIEAEWGVTDRLGLALETGTSRRDEDRRQQFAGVQLGAAYGFFHDATNDLHFQLESSAHLFGDAEAVAHEPGDTALPYAVQARGGFRRGTFSVRTATGIGFGAHSPHLPVRATMAFLGELPRGAGFAGIEVGVDGGRLVPYFVALDVFGDLTPLGIPARLGIALPWTPPGSGQRATLGIFLRVLVEFD